jgi:hypothetical protein
LALDRAQLARAAAKAPRSSSPGVGGVNHNHETGEMNMKQLRILGLALLALFALGAFTASFASAEEGVLPQQGAKVVKISGGVATLETLGEEFAVECKTLAGEATFLAASDQHAEGTLDFHECRVPQLNLQVNGLPDTEGLILIPVLFLICLVEPKKLVFGILILPTETVHLDIPFLGQLILVKGAAIGENLSGNEGKEFKLSLTGKGGDQTKPLSCEINGKKFSYSLEAANDAEGKTDKMASENASATVTFGETVKLMDT